jgi:flagellar hook-associated protein 3 FlgL
MRISSKSFELQWLTDIYRRQSELARVQKQVTSGRRIATASDDPAGAAQIVRLQSGLSRLANQAASAETARRRLTLAEGALDQVGNALDRIRELTIQAGGVNQTAEGRAAIANEARELLDSLVDIANTQDGEGRYLFSGNRVLTAAVSMAGGRAVYNGDDGVRALQISDHRTITENDPGSEVFFGIRSGNGTFSVSQAPANQGSAYFSDAQLTNASAWSAGSYTLTFTAPDSYVVTDGSGGTVASGTWTSGNAIAFNGASIVIAGAPVAGDEFTVAQSANQSIFDTAAELVGALELSVSTPSERASLQTALNRTLQNLDQAQSHVSEIRSRAGTRLAIIDDQMESNSELELELQKTLSTVRDVDLAAAVSELQTQLLGLEAAQKVFAQTRSLSLFDVL